MADPTPLAPAAGGAGRAGGAGNRRPDPARLLTPRGLHSHDVPEICIALMGHATLAVGQRLYPLVPPALAILPAGVLHAEGFNARRQPYAVLWLQYCSDSSLIGVVSHYRPEHAWQCPQRYALRTGRAGAVCQLLDKLSALPLPDPATMDTPAPSEPIRADLLHVLAELNCRFHAQSLASRAGRGGEEASAGRPCPHQDVLERVQDFLDHNYAKPNARVDLDTVATLTRFTPNYLNALFTRWKGQAIHEYLTALRMRRALELCRQGQLSVKEIACQLGYSDPLYFSRAFKRYHGRWPTEATSSGQTPLLTASAPPG
jgi:AraC-like DNA-binding protein